MSNLIYYPNYKLRKVTKDIDMLTYDIKSSINMLLYTVNKENGIGIAANQVGYFTRMFIIEINGKKVVVINPKVVLSKEKKKSLEACLSIGKFFYNIKRFKKARLTYINKFNKKKQITLKNDMSYCIQHEIDHLNGILFIDHLNYYDFLIFIKWYMSRL